VRRLILSRRFSVVFQSDKLIPNRGGAPAMFKKAREIEVGDRVIDRGTRFTVEVIQILVAENRIAFFDTEGVRHGPYHLDEYLGVEAGNGD